MRSSTTQSGWEGKGKTKEKIYAHSDANDPGDGNGNRMGLDRSTVRQGKGKKADRLSEWIDCVTTIHSHDHDKSSTCALPILLTSSHYQLRIDTS